MLDEGENGQPEGVCWNGCAQRKGAQVVRCTLCCLVGRQLWLELPFIGEGLAWFVERPLAVLISGSVAFR